MKYIKVDKTDSVNRTLTAIGATNIFASGFNYWISAERQSYKAWCYYGSTGIFDYIGKHGNYTVRPITAF